MKMVESVQIMKAELDEYGETAVYVVSYDDAKTTPQEISDRTLEFGYPSKVLLAEDPNI